MCKKYEVTEIWEMDFGCEERPEGMEDLVQVQLCSDAGEKITLQIPDDCFSVHIYFQYSLRRRFRQDGKGDCCCAPG